MLRSLILFMSSAVFIALGVLAVLVYHASPGPAGQEIQGVGFNSGAGFVYLSGRRLDCQRQADAPYRATCTVKIEGQLLTIQAARGGPDQILGGVCQADYAGQTWPCDIGSRHVHIHWFAYIRDPLGLDGAQLSALRQNYYFENLPEEPFLYGALIAPVLAALAFFSGWSAWRRPSGWRGWAAAVGLTLAVFISAFVVTFQLSYGFWD